MRSSMLSGLLIAASLLLLPEYHSPGQEKKKEPKGLLDGMTFAGMSVETGKNSEEPDTIKFKKGRFHSKGCDSWGFEKAKYSAEKDGEAVTFESVTMSAKEGRIAWKGVVKGNMCEVNYTWTKEGQKPIDYVFTGMLKKKKGRD